MSKVLDGFAATHADDVARRGNEVFVAIEAANDVIDLAERDRVRVLGLEGFLIDGEEVYPALSRIADFSGESAADSVQRARAVLANDWASTPAVADQIAEAARGRHMIAIVLDD